MCASVKKQNFKSVNTTFCLIINATMILINLSVLKLFLWLLKSRKTPLFTISGGFICHCHAPGSTVDWWQTPDARTPGSMTCYFNTGFFPIFWKGEIFWKIFWKREILVVLWTSAFSTCSEPLGINTPRWLQLNIGETRLVNLLLGICKRWKRGFL